MKAKPVKRQASRFRCRRHADRPARVRGLCWGCIKAEQRAKKKAS